MGVGGCVLFSRGTGNLRRASLLSSLSKDGAAETAAHLLLRGHVPAPSSGQQQQQSVGAVFLFHRKQVRGPWLAFRFPHHLLGGSAALRPFAAECVLFEEARCPLLVMTYNISCTLTPARSLLGAPGPPSRAPSSRRVMQTTCAV